MRNVRTASLLLLSLAACKTASSAPPAEPASQAPAMLTVVCPGSTADTPADRFLLRIDAGSCAQHEANSKLEGSCDGPDGSQARGVCAGGTASCISSANSGCCALGTANDPPHCGD